MTGFVPPAYPYDRLAPILALASQHDGGAVDLSVGAPCDPPAAPVLEALGRSDSERGYPPSVGTSALRTAAAGWFGRRLEVEVHPDHIAACVGTKEFVASVPHWLHLRNPSRDTVLYPAISYPSYEMGALLAGCRAVPVPVSACGTLELSSISSEDAQRAVCLWSNSPANPSGGLDDLGAAADWGRRHSVPVLSDECYVEYTWQGPPRGEVQLPGETILRHGEHGVLAVHSLSKRSNLAGVRVGFYAGDPELVGYLSEVRKHAGLMVPGPAQAAGAAALGDDRHVVAQRTRYRRRLELLAGLLEGVGFDVELPAGGFYLWVPAPDGDAWALAVLLAERLGIVGSPGEFYGPDAAGHLRLAAVQPDERLELLLSRAGGAQPTPRAAWLRAQA